MVGGGLLTVPRFIVCGHVLFEHAVGKVSVFLSEDGWEFWRLHLGTVSVSRSCQKHSVKLTLQSSYFLFVQVPLQLLSFVFHCLPLLQSPVHNFLFPFEAESFSLFFYFNLEYPISSFISGLAVMSLRSSLHCTASA